MAGTSRCVVLAVAVVGDQALAEALVGAVLVGVDSSNSHATTSRTSHAGIFPPDLLQPTTAMGAPFAKCASRQDIRRLNAGTVLMRIMFQRNDTLLLL